MYLPDRTSAIDLDHGNPRPGSPRWVEPFDEKLDVPDITSRECQAPHIGGVEVERRGELAFNDTSLHQAVAEEHDVCAPRPVIGVGSGRPS